MRSALFLLFLAVAALTQDMSSVDDTATDDAESDTITEPATQSTKTATSAKHSSSQAQPNSQQCIVACTAPIARQYGCTSIRDFKCVCGSEDFKDDMNVCLKKNCTKDQMAAAVGMIKGNCDAYTSSSSVHATMTLPVDDGWPKKNDASQLHSSFRGGAVAGLATAGGFLAGALAVL
ncbi:hypothetical protein BD626DRAFT_235219 [Schizophyllum amplum]|uniref:CFEM domain-containing protein n=1 Tax=Schizophyllum amplum TaxID=97359 RepID=A0A550CJ60_9AGAR|nr:hypothetical protein BD626DRAFT_235219 [Auriculariopsis ampla]